MTAFASFGVNHTDSVKVFFSVGSSRFDPSLGDNRAEMDSFILKVRDATRIDDIENIVVRAYASPDGTSKVNELLARKRCDAISDYIEGKAGVNPKLIVKIPAGIAWDGLRELVEKTPDVPSRNAVLNILSNTPLWIYDKDGRVIDGRKSQLMSLDRGVPYRWMLRHLFPQLRNAVAVTMMTKGVSSPVKESEDIRINVSEPEIRSTEKSDSIVNEESTGKPLVPEFAEDSELSERLPIEQTENEIVSTSRQRFALKTNILYDACLFPNLELEWLINRKWSVGLEGDIAWYKLNFTHIYRLAVISPEVRYHYRQRAPWHGMYVGLFLGGGLFQLENGHDGYRGEGGMGGVSFGYMWPIGKYFSLEAGIGVGYLYSRYKVYENRDTHKLYMRTKSLNYFGPLKLKFSIAWRFDFMKKSVKVNSTK